MSKRRNFWIKSKEVKSDYKFVERPFYWEKCENPTRLEELIFFRTYSVITSAQYKSLKNVELESYINFKKNRNLNNLIIYRRCYGNLDLVNLANQLKDFDDMCEALDYVDKKLEFYYPSKIQFLCYLSQYDDVKSIVESIPYTSYSKICEAIREETKTYILSKARASKIISEIKDRMEILFPHLISIETGETGLSLLELEHKFRGITFNRDGIAFEYENNLALMWDSFSFDEIIDKRKYLIDTKRFLIPKEERLTEKELIIKEKEEEEQLERFQLYLELKNEFKDWEKSKK